ncbi:adenylate/guanylate cyclase domain-containing protein [Allomesorhizobium alhagi]|uniref:Adenylate class-3/4/guanylyl cyclase n=1 Tax=Mesorhizobium alhagi CCNWXJ12-2 TaxID=1107882 RepID=H0HUN4_9HYPH|nr:adenylate/guanylate cyclase domain-containing protein [Mesorhizobium alhagi]EHK55580.1 adenylate class-3/4/guanylyl cyclase [Mesorhizobium alhagi CCNWXJ12-2]
MADERAKRRLAAIAVADVVGYSRLMETDEAGTLAVLKERRKTVLEPIVRSHEGRIVKVMGDGVLMEFASAVNAVGAALELQEKMAEANTLLNEDRRIFLRIGINLGDIICEGSDVYGDGVNIAARLEALAEPGGICLSAKVRDETRGRLELAFEDMREQQLKNIANPVRVFRVADWAISAAVGPSLSLPDKPSIAVLPFTNMSGDPEQQYFSDGITEDIITELSRSRALFVIARNSSFQYRDKAVDVRRVGRDLGVRYVFEGSVRKMGSRIRITAQLIDAVPGNHLWSERFDRGIEELFDVQDELTQTIVATVAGRLEDAEIRMAANKRTDSLPAYDCLLRGIQRLRGYDPDDNRLARELFEQAVVLDPRYALAHAYLALSLLVENHYGGVRCHQTTGTGHCHGGGPFGSARKPMSHLPRAGLPISRRVRSGNIASRARFGAQSQRLRWPCSFGRSVWRLRPRRRGHRTVSPGHQARPLCEICMGHPCHLSIRREAL